MCRFVAGKTGGLLYRVMTACRTVSVKRLTPAGSVARRRCALVTLYAGILFVARCTLVPVPSRLKSVSLLDPPGGMRSRCHLFVAFRTGYFLHVAGGTFLDVQLARLAMTLNPRRVVARRFFARYGKCHNRHCEYKHQSYYYASHCRLP